MTNYIGRQQDLKTKLNRHLTKITGQEKDYYQALSQADLAELKNVLSDINNVFTLKLTLTATEWLCQNFSVASKLKKDILNRIDEIKPNTNGFDILINEPNLKIVAEVKCVFPSNNGSKYFAAQRNSILDDAYKLVNGKKQLPDTNKYHKFLFIIYDGQRTDLALDTLLKPSKGTSDKEIRKNRHEIKVKIELLKDKTISELSTEKVYLKTLPITDYH
jgi:hypothetical protein